MELIDVTNAKVVYKRYGGQSCVKLCVLLDGDLYLVKFPGNLKNKGNRSDWRSYSNSPVCEYIGSHIYEIFGIPVHETRLARYKDKTVVLCKDFEGKDKQLQEFRQIRVGHVESMNLSDDYMKGHGGKLNEVLHLCDKDELLNKVKGIKTFLFEMILLDGFISNFDRNNGNWGVLLSLEDYSLIGPAPVFDNGNCLCDKWTDTKMLERLEDPEKFEACSITSVLSYFTKDDESRYNPFKLLKQNEYSIYTLVAKGLFKTDHMEEINRLIDSVICISETQNRFYKETLKRRYEEITKIISEINLDTKAILKMYRSISMKEAYSNVLHYISLVGNEEEALVNLYNAGLLKI